MIKNFLEFAWGSAKLAARGSLAYYAWILFLGTFIALGAVAYFRQFNEGLIVTAMRDQVMWGLYIGNFTFLVGVAAAAVVLVIPAYVYDWEPIKEIVLIGELLAVSALVMCLLFIGADIGRPDRLWHPIPLLGVLHFPSSIMAWDMIVLNLYLVLNVSVATHIIYRSYHGKPYSKSFVWPMVIFSIPLAVSIHTVTAFLYNGLPARPFWNASILAPRFLASAFCSGPAIILILLQLLRRFFGLKIKEEAIWKIAELMAYAMAVNLFLLISEVFREGYSDTHHLVHTRYLYFGIGEHTALTWWAWLSVGLSAAAFFLFLVPATRKNPLTLNLGCVMIYLGAYLEKGMALIIPGLTPDTLGESYEYTPTLNEF
ncbi:MAG: polysulfide reductase NrfD, partial [Candidatus Riflebacteria bacterium]|nr:polysulfide reductase NrfD [Candidatus Riflebacteria bacterium]